MISAWRSLTGTVALLLLIAHTVVAGFFVFLLLFFKLPSRGRLRDCADAGIEQIATIWVGGILWWIRHCQAIEWDIDGLDSLPLRQDQWYLVTANHQSWVDIFVLFYLYHRKTPFLKFFIKQQMLWFPILGQVWWALDFPFMKRYNRQYLERHPEKAGQDLAATRRACAIFSRRPTSVMTFLEGTRFTDDKHRYQNSPYRHLLKPKTGGLTFTLQSLGSRFQAIHSVTIVYPDGAPGFWKLLSGAVPRIVVRVEEVAIPAFIHEGDYENDPDFKKQAQDWVNGLWVEKDRLLEALRA